MVEDAARLRIVSPVALQLLESVPIAQNTAKISKSLLPGTPDVHA